MKTAIYNMLKYAANALAPVLGFVVAIWIIWNVETRFFPVATKFTITAAFADSKGYTAIGTVEKFRNCEIVGLTLSRSRDQEPMVILDQQRRDLFLSDALLGQHSWGPLVLPLTNTSLKDTDIIRITALHRCHAMWLQQTEYLQESWASLKKVTQSIPPTWGDLPNQTPAQIRFIIPKQ